MCPFYLYGKPNVDSSIFIRRDKAKSPTGVEQQQCAQEKLTCATARFGHSLEKVCNGGEKKEGGVV